MPEIDKGITLPGLLYTIKKHGTFVFVMTFACFALAVVYAWGIVNVQYTVTASLSAPSQIASVNAYLVSSESKAVVVDALGVTDLSSYSISSATNSAYNSANVTVKGPNAEQAALIANQLIKATTEFASNHLDVSTVVLSFADASSAKASPNRLMYVCLGLSGGFFVAICIVGIREMLKISFTSSKEIEEILGVPVLAAFPKKNKTTTSSKDCFRKNILQLVANISFYFENRLQASVAVIGTDRNNEQALLSAELAIALAKQGKRVVLVDADMTERPLEAILPYKKPPAKPLSAYFDASAANADDIVGHSNIDLLDIVYADNNIPNASLVYSSLLFEELIQELYAAFDCVVINTPIGLIDDTIKVASLADATLLVIACSDASRSDVINLYRSLSEANVKTIGSVLTQVKKKVAAGTQ